MGLVDVPTFNGVPMTSVMHLVVSAPGLRKAVQLQVELRKRVNPTSF